MDAHPVPQNVTTFQFHLVGDMTLKQFLYLAVGLGLSYLLFVFLFPLAPVLAVPLITISALLGVAFAFLPIQDRPLDHWLKAYIAAIMSPTKRFWANPSYPGQKTEPQDPVFKNKLPIFLSSLGPAPAQPYSPPPPPPKPPLSRLSTPVTIPIATQPPPPPPPPKKEEGPSEEELKKLVEQAKQSQMLQAKIIELEGQVNQLKSLSTQPPPVGQPSPTIQPVRPSNVVTVTPPKPEKTQPLLTSSPNVINGIVSDPAGNYLEGVIVIIHNKDNLPVRALKTNKLGQFTGATPLPPGVYTLTLEKDGFLFDTLQVTLNGEVMAPIQISARKGAA